MFKFALKSLKSKKTISILYVIALSISMVISMLSINISSQIQEGFFRVDQKYDVIVGNKGSSTQLVMSSIFFSEEPLGTLPYSVVDDIKNIDITINYTLDNYITIIGNIEDVYYTKSGYLIFRHQFAKQYCRQESQHRLK